MRIGYCVAVLVALFAAFSSVPVSAAEILTLKAVEGRFKVTFYPDYFLFLKGLDPSTIKTKWVDKEYYAVLDMHAGPEAGKSVIVTLKTTTDRSPQPEWCKTEGGDTFEGLGITCLKAPADFTEQLRFKVTAKYADSAASLPAELRDRTWVEYPDMPGRRESEVLGPFDLHIVLD